MSPASFARCTACVRRRAESLPNTRAACVFTVFSLTNNRFAISRLLNPAASSSRISSSRGVMPSCSSRVSFRANGPVDRHRYLDGDLDMNGHLAHDHRLARPRELEPEPDPDSREEDRDEPAIDLERSLDDEIAILHDLENGDEGAAEDAVDEDGLLHASHDATEPHPVQPCASLVLGWHFREIHEKIEITRGEAQLASE